MSRTMSSVSFHEAGHAVVAGFVLGDSEHDFFSIDDVSIIPDAEENRLGVVLSKDYMPFDLGSVENAVTLWHKRRIIFYLSGFSAEGIAFYKGYLKHCGCTFEDLEIGSSCDENEAFALADKIQSRQWTSHRIMKKMMEYATEAVDELWPYVLELAQILEDHKSITGEEFIEFCSPFMGGASRNSKWRRRLYP